MIAISHNCDEVLKWLTDLAAAAESIPQSVLVGGQYIPALVEKASRVLNERTATNEKAVIPALINTIRFYLQQDTVSFEMSGVSESALADVAPGEIGYNQLAPLEEDIAAWVRDQKKKTERDQYKGGHTHDPGEAIPDEAIARRIMAIFGQDPKKWLGSTNDTGLLAYLRKNAPDKLEEVFGLTPLGQDRVSELLGHVLTAWHDLMSVQVVDVALQRIDSALR